MITILQPAGGIAADGLEMGGRIRGIQDILISRRHGESGQPSDRGAVVDAPIVRSEVDPPPPATAPPDCKVTGPDMPQPSALHEGASSGGQGGGWLVGAFGALPAGSCRKVAGHPPGLRFKALIQNHEFRDAALGSLTGSSCDQGTERTFTAHHISEELLSTAIITT
jgi:hypothetical protein